MKVNKEIKKMIARSQMSCLKIINIEINKNSQDGYDDHRVSKVINRTLMGSHIEFYWVFFMGY